MPRRYAFVTVWELEAPVSRVWDEIVAVARWPEWWPAVRRVEEIARGGDDGVGATHRFTWRGRLPYTLTFAMRITEAVRHERLEGVADGELRGTGVWTFAPAPGGVRLRYDWVVETTKAWMNALAPLLEPAFRWNHDAVMQGGGEGLARRLGSRLP